VSLGHYWKAVASLPNRHRLFADADRARQHLQLFLTAGGDRALQLHEDAQAAISQATADLAYHQGQQAGAGFAHDPKSPDRSL